MIKFNQITKLYGEKRAVDNLSMEIDRGEIFGFIGPNGAGKTTTINMMVGISKPTEGEILIEGIDIRKDPLKAKEKFYFIPDNPHIYEKLKAKEYLNFIGDIYQIESQLRLKRLKKYLDLFEISGELNSTIGSFSHGMKQKLMLTAGLMVEPDLLILDEPMTGLDPKSSYNLKEIMKDYAQAGRTVFFSTHVLEVAENLCSKIAIISRGKLINFGSMEDLKRGREDQSLENIFLELTK